MKFSLKLVAALCLLSLCLTFLAATAQTTDINSVNSPTAVNLNSVCIVTNITGANDDLTQLNAWAVGGGGTIVHWNGNSWSTDTSPTSDNLYSVVFTNATNGWAVGGAADRGVILHYNGTWNIWNRISFSGYKTSFDTINSTLYSVTVDSSCMNGWIVGASGIALNWDGDTWFAMTNISHNNLRSVAMVHGSTDAWAVGDGGTILHWTGTTWNTMTSPTTEPLHTIQMVTVDNGWAAGGTGSNGVVVNLNGSTWKVWNEFIFDVDGGTTQTVNSTIYSISAANQTAAWAAGSNGTVMYYDGTAWTCNAQVTSGHLKSVSMVHGSSTGSIQAWAVGDSGKIMAFNGTTWVPEIPLMAVPLLLGIGLLVAITAKLKLRKPVLVK
jgi:hypothetical protein